MSSSSTLFPGDYSTAQQAVAFFGLTISGLLSLLSSIAVVFHIVRRHTSLLRKKQVTNGHSQREPGKKEPATNREEDTTINVTSLELRLVFFQAVVYILVSIMFVVYDYMIPKDFPDYWLNQGNAASCRVQGFVQQFKSSADYYLVAVLLLSLWTMCQGYTDSELIARRIEWWIHGVALGFPVVTAVIGVILNQYHPSSTLGCFYADTPLGCHTDDSGVECEDDTQNVYIYAWLFAGLPLLGCFGVMSFVLVSLYAYIRHLYQVVDEMEQEHYSNLNATDINNEMNRSVPTSIRPGSYGENSEASARSRPLQDSALVADCIAQEMAQQQENPNDHMQSERTQPMSHRAHQRRNGMMRFVAVEQDTVLTLAFYVGGFALTHFTLYVCLLLDQTSTRPPYAIRLLHNILWPLQGFLNLLVFLRPRVAYLRRNEPGLRLTYWQAAYRVILFYESPTINDRDAGRASVLALAGSTSIRAIDNQDDKAMGWTQTDVNQARQLARAMSSRKGSSMSFSSSSAASSRLLRGKGKQQSKQISTTNLTTITAFDEDSPTHTGLPEVGSAAIAVAAKNRAAHASVKTMTQENVPPDESDALERDTYHGTRKESRFKIVRATSWSKLNMSDHWTQRKEQDGAIAVSGGRRESAKSSSYHDDSEGGETFGDDNSEDKFRQRRMSVNSSTLGSIVESDDGHDVVRNSRGEGRNSSSEGIPRDIGSEEGFIAEEALGNLDSLVSFPSKSESSIEIRENPTEAEICHHMPPRDESGVQLSALNTTSLPVAPRDPDKTLSSFSQTASSQLDSVLECEFEDSRADLSTSEIFLPDNGGNLQDSSPNNDQFTGLPEENLAITPGVADKKDSGGSNDATRWDMLSDSSDNNSSTQEHALPSEQPLKRSSVHSHQNILASVAEYDHEDSTNVTVDENVGMLVESSTPSPLLELGSQGSIRSNIRNTWKYQHHSNHSGSAMSWGMLGESDKFSSTKSFAGSTKSFASSARSFQGSTKSFAGSTGSEPEQKELAQECEKSDPTKSDQMVTQEDVESGGVILGKKNQANYHFV